MTIRTFERTSDTKQNVLFVCLGNICRSPLGEGVLRHLVAGQSKRALAIEVDSAGTEAYHAGEAPDQRSVDAAARRDISLEGQSARQVQPEDFENFDWILAMDSENLKNLARMRPDSDSATAKICLLRDFDPAGRGDVPDPYYGSADGFDEVLEMLHRSCEAFLDQLSGS